MGVKMVGGCHLREESRFGGKKKRSKSHVLFETYPVWDAFSGTHVEMASRQQDA